MAVLEWDKTGERLYETGVDHMVLYPYDKNAQDKTKAYKPGVAWNGVTSVQDSPSGAENTDIWADNLKYLSLTSKETYGATIEAYTYPDEFAVLDGSAEIATGVTIGQQDRGLFGYSYRSLIGNDIENENYGYKLHLVYGAKAQPSEQQHQTINDSPEAGSLSWTISTTPVNVTGKKPTASLVIDSTKVDSTKLKALEKILYGDTDADPYLPLPDEVARIFAAG